jgi:hypothetical protein
MQKVVGSSPIIRSPKAAANRAVFVPRGAGRLAAAPRWSASSHGCARPQRACSNRRPPAYAPTADGTREDDYDRCSSLLSPRPAARGDEPLWPGDGLPRGWEGSINDAICPGCQAVVLLER